MADESTTTPAASIRTAEEALESAQGVLDKAQSGLRAAEKAAIQVEKVERHPVRWILGLLAVGVVVVLVTRLLGSEEDS